MMFPLKHSLLLITLLLFGFTSSTSGQTVKLKEGISFAVSNVSVTDALDILASQTGNTFSYNPDHIQTSRIVKVDLHDRPLTEVISAILGSPNFAFRQIGNQIVIFRSKEQIPVQTDENTSTEGNPDHNITKPGAGNYLNKPDTVYVFKDIHDTVKVTEYITRTDTIIQKIATPVSGKEIFRNTTDLGKEFSSKVKFEIGGSLAFFLSGPEFSATDIPAGKLEQYNKSYSDKSLSGSAGLEINAKYQRWVFTTGLNFTSFNQKMDYNYLVESGGYYEKDTLDAYFELIDGEPKWTYLTDSVYIPIDNKLYDYKITNHTRYLEVPLTIGYNHPVSNMLVFVKTGIITGLFLNSDGSQIRVYENGVLSVNEIDSKKIVFSYSATIGLAIPLTRKLILSPGLSYRNHLASVYKDFPVKTRFEAVGIGASLSYKLY